MLGTKPMVMGDGFKRRGAAVAAPQSGRATAPTRFGGANMSLSMPAEAFVATAAKDPAASSQHGSQALTTLVSALRLAGHYQRLLSKVLFSLLLRASLFASGFLHFGWTASVAVFRAATSIVYHSVQFLTQAAWNLWDSPQGRRLRKKLEFEFFTLILGGGNNLCLIIFWPGWCILAITAVVLSAWYAT